jgi:hypothetical protein
MKNIAKNPKKQIEDKEQNALNQRHRKREHVKL